MVVAARQEWFDGSGWGVDDVLALLARIQPGPMQEPDRYLPARVVGREELGAFEEAYACVVPRGYREYLSGIGNGGPGPGPQGLWALDGGPTRAGRQHRGAEVEQLWSPFLHEDEFGPEPRDVSGDELRFWCEDNLGGLLTITTFGDTFYAFLVVTESRSGEVWINDDQGFYRPWRTAATGRGDFVAWMSTWLDEVAGRDEFRPRAIGEATVGAVPPAAAEATKGVLAQVWRFARDGEPGVADAASDEEPLVAAARLRGLYRVDAARAASLARDYVDHEACEVRAAALQVLACVAQPADATLLTEVARRVENREKLTGSHHEVRAFARLSTEPSRAARRRFRR